MRAWLALSVLLLALPLSGAEAPRGFYEQEGVTYYMAVGAVGSGHATTHPDYAAQDLLPFSGCVIAKMRPDRELGRVQVLGQLDGVPFNIDMAEFDAPRQDMQGGIAVDLPVDGSRMHPGPNGTGEIQHPAVQAEVAAWGEALMEAAGAAVPDPATGFDAMQATFFVTPNGYRNDTTGAIRTPDGRPYQPGLPAQRGSEDWEAHLRLESLPGPAAPPSVRTSAEPTPMLLAGVEVLPPEDPYYAPFSYPVDRFGGEATVSVRASSLAPAGETELAFVVRGPTGAILDTLDLSPDVLGGEQTASTTFPLARLGAIEVDVLGKVSLAEYEIRVEQRGPERFDLHLWWDEVQRGSYAPQAITACEEAISGSSAPIQAHIAARPPPTPWPAQAVALTSMAGLAGVLVFVKLVMMASAAAAHRRITQS